MLVSDWRVTLISAIETSQQYHAPRTKAQLGGVHTVIVWKCLHLHIEVSGCDWLFSPQRL